MEHNGIAFHHAEGPPTITGDVYDEIFDNGKVGDWYWGQIIWTDDESYRCMHMLVPSLRGEGQGPLEGRGAEIALVFPSHGPNNWSEPGSDNGWDGNEEEPTFSPSIFVGGSSDKPGWHGFFEKGMLRDA